MWRLRCSLYIYGIISSLDYEPRTERTAGTAFFYSLVLDQSREQGENRQEHPRARSATPFLRFVIQPYY